MSTPTTEEAPSKLRASAPVRVLHVIDCPRTGGAQSMIAAHLRELERTARAESVVCVADGRGTDPEIVDAYREHSLALHVIGRHRMSDPLLLSGMIAAVRRFRPDVVHAHPGNIHPSSKLAAFLLRRPLVSTIHTPPGPNLEDSPRRALVDGWTSHLSTVIVAPSEQIALPYARAYRIPQSRFRIIPNPAPSATPEPGFDASRLRSELSANGAEPRVVVCIARLKPKKGIADLIEAAALIKDKVPGLVVAVAGEGPEKESLRERINALGLGRTVHLLGHRRDVGNLLAAADAFCLPSHHEGLPVSVLEAMGAGVPCVATAVGGTGDLVRDGETGLLVAPCAAESLAAALQRVLSDGGLARRLGAGGRLLVERDYAPAAVTARYADLYDALAEHGRAARRASRDLLAGLG